MRDKAEENLIKRKICENLTALCKQSLAFKSNLNIKALIGITVDDEDVVLVDIQTNASSSEFALPLPAARTASQKASAAGVVKTTDEPRVGHRLSDTATLTEESAVRTSPKITKPSPPAAPDSPLTIKSEPVDCLGSVVIKQEGSAVEIEGAVTAAEWQHDVSSSLSAPTDQAKDSIPLHKNSVTRSSTPTSGRSVSRERSNSRDRNGANTFRSRSREPIRCQIISYHGAIDASTPVVTEVYSNSPLPHVTALPQGVGDNGRLLPVGDNASSYAGSNCGDDDASDYWENVSYQSDLSHQEDPDTATMPSDTLQPKRGHGVPDCDRLKDVTQTDMVEAVKAVKCGRMSIRLASWLYAIPMFLLKKAVNEGGPVGLYMQQMDKFCDAVDAVRSGRLRDTDAERIYCINKKSMAFYVSGKASPFACTAYAYNKAFDAVLSGEMNFTQASTKYRVSESALRSNMTRYAGMNDMPVPNLVERIRQAVEAVKSETSTIAEAMLKYKICENTLRRHLRTQPGQTDDDAGTDKQASTDGGSKGWMSAKRRFFLKQVRQAAKDVDNRKCTLAEASLKYKVADSSIRRRLEKPYVPYTQQTYTLERYKKAYNAVKFGNCSVNKATIRYRVPRSALRRGLEQGPDYNPLLRHDKQDAATSKTETNAPEVHEQPDVSEQNSDSDDDDDNDDDGASQNEDYEATLVQNVFMRRVNEALTSIRNGELSVSEASAKYRVSTSTIHRRLAPLKQRHGFAVKRTIHRQPKTAYSLEQYINAYNAVVKDNMSRSTAAKKYGVPVKTLQRGVRLGPSYKPMIRKTKTASLLSKKSKILSAAKSSKRPAFKLPALKMKAFEAKPEVKSSSYTMEDYAKAVEAVASGSMILTQASRKFGIPLTTLCGALRRRKQAAAKEADQSQSGKSTSGDSPQKLQSRSADTPDASTPEVSASKRMKKRPRDFKFRSYSLDAYNKALAAVRSGSMNAGEASRTFGVPKTTLSRELGRRDSSDSRKSGNESSNVDISTPARTSSTPTASSTTASGNVSLDNVQLKSFSDRYTSAELTMAVQSVLNGDMMTVDASRMYGIPPSTLSYKIHCLKNGKVNDVQQSPQPSSSSSASSSQAPAKSPQAKKLQQPQKWTELHDALFVHDRGNDEYKAQYKRSLMAYVKGEMTGADAAAACGLHKTTIVKRAKQLKQLVQSVIDGADARDGSPTAVSSSPTSSPSTSTSASETLKSTGDASASPQKANSKQGMWTYRHDMLFTCDRGNDEFKEQYKRSVKAVICGEMTLNEASAACGVGTSGISRKATQLKQRVALAERRSGAVSQNSPVKAPSVSSSTKNSSFRSTKKIKRLPSAWTDLHDKLFSHRNGTEAFKLKYKLAVKEYMCGRMTARKAASTCGVAKNAITKKAWRIRHLVALATGKTTPTQGSNATGLTEPMRVSSGTYDSTVKDTIRSRLALDVSRRYTPTQLVSAVKAVRSGESTHKQAAQKFKIPLTTLYRNLRSPTKSFKYWKRLHSKRDVTDSQESSTKVADGSATASDDDKSGEHDMASSVDSQGGDISKSENSVLPVGQRARRQVSTSTRTHAYNVSSVLLQEATHQVVVCHANVGNVANVYGLPLSLLREHVSLCRQRMRDRKRREQLQRKTALGLSRKRVGAAKPIKRRLSKHLQEEAAALPSVTVDLGRKLSIVDIKQKLRKQEERSTADASASAEPEGARSRNVSESSDQIIISDEDVSLLPENEEQSPGAAKPCSSVDDTSNQSEASANVASSQDKKSNLASRFRRRQKSYSKVNFNKAVSAVYHGRRSVLSAHRFFHVPADVIRDGVETMKRNNALQAIQEGSMTLRQAAEFFDVDALSLLDVTVPEATEQPEVTKQPEVSVEAPPAKRKRTSSSAEAEGTPLAESGRPADKHSKTIGDDVTAASAKKRHKDDSTNYTEWRYIEDISDADDDSDAGCVEVTRNDDILLSDDVSQDSTPSTANNSDIVVTNSSDATEMNTDADFNEFAMPNLSAKDLAGLIETAASTPVPPRATIPPSTAHASHSSTLVAPVSKASGNVKMSFNSSCPNAIVIEPTSSSRDAAADVTTAAAAHDMPVLEKEMPVLSPQTSDAPHDVMTLSPLVGSHRSVAATSAQHQRVTASTSGVLVSINDRQPDKSFVNSVRSATNIRATADSTAVTKAGRMTSSGHRTHVTSDLRGAVRTTGITGHMTSSGHQAHATSVSRSAVRSTNVTPAIVSQRSVHAPAVAKRNINVLLNDPPPASSTGPPSIFNNNSQAFAVKPVARQYDGTNPRQTMTFNSVPQRPPPPPPPPSSQPPAPHLHPPPVRTNAQHNDFMMGNPAHRPPYSYPSGSGGDPLLPMTSRTVAPQPIIIQPESCDRSSNNAPIFTDRRS